MTAKRFFKDGNEIVTWIRDKENWKKLKTNDEIVELLNELHEEKESLKEENMFLRNKVATYKSGNALLKSTMDKEWK